MNRKNIIPIGFRLFNEILGGGFHNGRLNVIVSRAGVGKTTFAMQCAADISKAAEKPIYFLSCDMSLEQIKERYKDISGVDRFLIDDTKAITLFQIREKFAVGFDIAAILIDFLHLVPWTQFRQTPFVAKNLEELKSIAKETGIPVICTSQLPNDVDRRKDRHPILSDIEEPLMQNADVILSVYRDSYYDETADQFAAEIGVLKNRYGGCMTLPFQWSFPKFSEYGIDKMIDYSCEKVQTELTALLLEYKNKHFGFTDNNKRFRL